MNNIEVIDQVMESLGAMYPSWSKMARDKDVRYVWARAMNRAGITLDDIKRGIQRAERDASSFPPSVGQFISWCVSQKQATPAQAYQQAALGKYMSPEALEAAKRTGEFDLKNNPSQQVRRLFEDHYRDVLDEKANGKVFELPKPKAQPRQIEYTSEVTQAESDTTAKGRATFSALRAILTTTAEEKTNVDTKLES